MEESLETPSEEDDNQEELYTIHSASKSRPYVAALNVDEESMLMEIGTGASLSLVDVCVNIMGRKLFYPFVVIRGVGLSLLGKNWLNK